MSYYKKMKGNNVYLSPISINDCDTYCKWMNDCKITDNIGRSAKVTNEINNKNWFLQAINDGKYVFSIVKEENDKLIGCCGINDIDLIHKTCEIYIYIGDNSDRGKGYGKESINLLINYIFNVLNINSIFIKAFEFNHAALHLYESIGFKRIGIRRKNYYINGKYYDTIYLDMLKEDMGK